MLANGNIIKRERNNMNRKCTKRNINRDGKWSDDNVIRERERYIQVF